MATWQYLLYGGLAVVIVVLLIVRSKQKS